MKRALRSVVKIILAILPLAVLILGIGGMLALASRKASHRREVAADQPPLVRTVEVVLAPGGLDLEADGVVVPFREVTVAAEISGRVVSKPEKFRAGRVVTQGEVLLKIDPRDYQLDVERLERQLAQSRATLEELAVEVANAEALIELSKEEWALQQGELKRVENLRRTVSESEIDRVKRAEWSSRNNLLSLRNQSQLLNARRRGLEHARDLIATQLEKARLDLERTEVVAPLDGIIVGDQVEQNSFVTKGAELFRIEDSSRVEVKFNLTMDDLAWIWRHAAARRAARGSQADASPMIGSTASGSVETAPHALSARHYELPPTPVTIVYQPAGTSGRRAWQGELSRLDGTGFDERTRTVNCRAMVAAGQQVQRHEEPDQGVGAPDTLLRGMFVKVLIHVQPEHEFLEVPEAALQPGKQLVRIRDGKLSWVGPVVLARQIEEVTAQGRQRSFLIPAGSGGLQAGDRIVVSPLVAATEGMPVREEAAPSPQPMPEAS